MLKFFVPPVPLLRAAIIVFWATFRVLLVFVAATFITVIFSIHMSPALNGVFAIIGLCAIGSLITHHLGQHYGLPTKFPAAGAKVVTSAYGLILFVTSVLYVVFLKVS